jgi:hypothetical protein
MAETHNFRLTNNELALLDAIKVPMDITEASAIQQVSMSEGWPLTLHYIARMLVATRDSLEVMPSDKIAGFAQGLRMLFELQARAEAHMNGSPFKRERQSIIGEAERMVSQVITPQQYANEEE